MRRKRLRYLHVSFALEYLPQWFILITETTIPTQAWVKSLEGHNITYLNLCTTYSVWFWAAPCLKQLRHQASENTWYLHTTQFLYFIDNQIFSDHSAGKCTLTYTRGEIRLVHIPWDLYLYCRHGLLPCRVLHTTGLFSYDFTTLTGLDH